MEQTDMGVEDELVGAADCGVATLPAYDTDPWRAERRRHLLAQAVACVGSGLRPTHSQLVELHRAGMPLSVIDRELSLEEGTTHDAVVYEMRFGSLGGAPKRGAR